MKTQHQSTMPQDRGNHRSEHTAPEWRASSPLTLELVGGIVGLFAVTTMVLTLALISEKPVQPIKCRTLDFLSSKQAYEGFFEQESVLTEISPAGPELSKLKGESLQKAQGFCEYSARVGASFGESTLFGLTRAQAPFIVSKRLEPATRVCYSSMNASQETEFVDLLTTTQGRLFGYIYSQLANPDGTREVLQETNIVLWKKRDQFEMGTNFWAWAQSTARFQIMAFRQKKRRDRLVFDDDVLQMVSAVATDADSQFDVRKEKLSRCIEGLDDKYQRMVRKRYSDGISVNDIAEQENMPANTVAQAMFRVRKKLIECVKRVNVS